LSEDQIDHLVDGGGLIKDGHDHGKTRFDVGIGFNWSHAGCGKSGLNQSTVLGRLLSLKLNVPKLSFFGHICQLYRPLGYFPDMRVVGAGRSVPARVIRG